jgi:two-component system NtrC family response regulator/two-component system response regulator HydG
VVLSERDTIDVDVLPLAETAGKRGDAGKPGLPAGLTLRDLERQYILQTLEGVGGSRTQAARLLGISLRCLQYKLKAYQSDGLESMSQVNRPAESQHPLGV